MKLLFLGASNTDCDHCFTDDGLGTGYVKFLYELLLTSESDPGTSGSLSSGPASDAGDGNSSSALLVVNGGTDGFTFPRIYQKWNARWRNVFFDAVFVLGGINEVGILMGMDANHADTEQELLLQSSCAALKQLLLGLTASGCRKICVLEPFLFDTPAYRKTWRPALRKVRTGIRKTVTDCAASCSDARQTDSTASCSDARQTDSTVSCSDARQTDSTASCSDARQTNACSVTSSETLPPSITYLPTQAVLDETAALLGLDAVTSDGIHLAEAGHRQLAAYLIREIKASGL